MNDKVLYRTEGKVAIITLNRPEQRNAVNGDVAKGLEACIDKMEADDNIYVGILTANMPAGQKTPTFCAGADLKAVENGTGHLLSTPRGGFGGFVYRQRRKPVIIAVDGLATAGGCEISLAGDILIATTRSSFGLAEVKRNLIAGAGGLFRLPRAIGQAAAMDAILTGEPLSAERAFQLGLVARLAAPGKALEEAMKLAAQITENAPLAIYASREVVLAAAYENDDYLKKLTQQRMAEVTSSPDTQEGLRAFIQKRKPNWTGKPGAPGAKSAL